MVELAARRDIMESEDGAAMGSSGLAQKPPSANGSMASLDAAGDASVDTSWDMILLVIGAWSGVSSIVVPYATE